MSARNDGSLRDCLKIVVNKTPEIIKNIEGLLNDEGYVIESVNGEFFIQGGVIIKAKPVINEAHFQDIQNKILIALDGAKVSIKVIMAWFTNDTLFNMLIKKHKQGVDVEISIYDDGVNKKHGVDITQLPHKRIKRGKRGGLMHDKFCVIDNQVVVTGSYNWTNVSAPLKASLIPKSATLNLLIQYLEHESTRTDVYIGRAMARVRIAKKQIL
jgi:hypothetical protein